MVTLTISPQDALIDVPRRICVTGLAQGEVVSLSSHTLRGPGVSWRSAARFQADAQGVVDLTRDAPLSDSQENAYNGVSPMGLIWSQKPDLAPQAARAWASRDVFASQPTAPLVTQIELMRTNGPEPSATHIPLLPMTGQLTQGLISDGVTRSEVREDGLVGTLFTPPTAGPHPVVMVLNGSGGGINEPRAALYASRGYAALALGYFKAPGLSDFISNTPLEYFETALVWIERTLRPAHGFVALSGQSRGGELVLLLGSMFPDRVSAVVAYVPGAVVHCAQNACDPAIGREGPAWLYKGQRIPDVWQGNRTATWAPWDNGPEPRRHTHAILTALDDPDAVARARIPVERIRGPVICLSASDDGSWPSSLYGRMVADKLSSVHHPWPVEHLDFDGGGHTIVFPYVPTTQLEYAHPVSGRLSTTGGAPAANAHADEASWAGVQAFLQRAVAARAAPQSTSQKIPT